MARTLATVTSRHGRSPLVQVHSTLHPMVRSMGRSMGRASSRCDPGRHCASQVVMALLVEPRRRQAPFRSESEVYSYGTAHDVPCCTVTGIDFNSPHSHANGFPAQRTGLPSCSVLDDASHACSSNKKSFPSYPRFRLRHAQPTWGLSIEHLAPCAR